MQELQYVVQSVEDNQLFGRIARTRLRMSYGQFKRAKFQGELLLDGVRVHADAKVRAGQVMTVRMPQNQGPAITPYRLDLSIPYRDEWLMVVDKPAPLSSTASKARDGQSLENALFWALGCPADYLYRPVNRLDKGTSGLMVAACNAHAQQLLQGLLHTDDFVREYLAVCEGAFPEAQGLIDLPIAKEDGASVRRVVTANGKPARTHYRVLEQSGGRSLVRLRLDTGRTHQIRVHSSALGCPIVGDFLYGKEHPALPGRFALHSCSVGLRHPLTGEWIHIKSPLPESLRVLI